MMVVRRADAIREQLEALEATKDEMLGHLNKPVSLALKVSGLVSGDCRVRALNLSDVHDSPSGAVEMTESWAETKVRMTPGGGALEAWSLSGKKNELQVEEPLRKGRFELKDETMTWIPSGK